MLRIVCYGVLEKELIVDNCMSIIAFYLEEAICELQEFEYKGEKQWFLKS